MSAIFGLVNWSGEPVAAGDVARVDAALTPYGPEGGAVWADGNAALGHRRSHITREDRLERQPVPCGDGSRMLVADARIDNGEELANAWSVASSERAGWPDSAFVARALDAWNDEAPARLRGAFAFALWDRREQRLLLARSSLSERPLFYSVSGTRFSFASTARALFALGVDPAVDEPYLADYLAYERLDPAGTFYRNIRRVPAGHVLVATPAGVRVQPFWPPQSLRELRLRSDRDYVDAFEDLFARVVRDAVRTDGNVGLLLSGGLDSASVAAVAAPFLESGGRRLAAFTEVPREGFTGPVLPGRYADETPLVNGLARRYTGIDLTLVRTDGRFFLDTVEGGFAASGVPVLRASNVVWIEAAMAAARTRGVRALLTGGGGNFTISYDGASAIAQMVGRGRWLRAVREARATARLAGGSPLRTLLGAGMAPWLPPSAYLAVQRLRGTQAANGHSRSPWRALSSINLEFARAHGVDERAAARGLDHRGRRSPDSRAARWQLLQRAGELQDGFGSGYLRRFGLDLRDPTTDMRLVEFCHSLPEDQFQRDGRRRWLIRRAMADRLPPGILDNPLRGLQAADWLERMRAHRADVVDAIARIEQSELARQAIDVARLRRLAAALPGVRPDDPVAIQEYRGVLEHGLATGLFVRWLDLDGTAS